MPPEADLLVNPGLSKGEIEEWAARRKARGRRAYQPFQGGGETPLVDASGNQSDDPADGPRDGSLSTKSSSPHGRE
jgi:hypothetical protein